MQKISQVNLSDKYVVNMGVKLGKGSTGSVYEGRDLRTNQNVAVKVIELATIDNEVTHYLLEMQKKALMAIDNPYVLKGLKIWQDKKFCFMVTEHCNGGTLKQYIHKNGKIDEQKSLDLIKKILQGYQQLVNKKITHRDLKPANIMLHENSPKIIDFGYCEIDGYRKPSLQYNVGSPSYMAPESFDLNIYNQKTQIWAIGVILFECVTGRTIDEGRKMTQAFKQIEQTGIPYPSHVSKKVRKIIDWCLSLSPRKRPTCKQLLKEFQLINSKEISLFRDITNQTLLSERYIEKSRRSSVNQKTDLNNEYMMMFQSTKVSATKKSQAQNDLDKSKPRFIPNNNKYIENRVRPVYSNYVKPKSTNNTIQQPELFPNKAQLTDRPASKIMGFNWDYGISKNQTNTHMKRKNNYLVPSNITGRQTFKGITLYQAAPSLAQRRSSKRVESHYSRPYRI